MEHRKFVFVYFDNAELCDTPQQAIAFINRLYCGNTRLVCNSNCQERIYALFEGDIVYYPATGYMDYVSYKGKRIPGFEDLATTGCSTTRINIFPALADTLDEHNRIYREKAEEAKAERLREAQERIRKRNEELNEQRPGWYAVSLHFDNYKVGDRGSYYADTEFSGKIIADSGLDAYAKTIRHLEQSPDVGNSSLYPEAVSSHYWFKYLGILTDEGYSEEFK